MSAFTASLEHVLIAYTHEARDGTGLQKLAEALVSRGLLLRMET